MASKPEIPAWQRAPIKRPDDSRGRDEPSSEPPAAVEQAIQAPESAEQAAAKPTSSEDSQPPSDASMNPAQQLDRMRAMLDEPAIANAPAVKQRALFESKGMSPTLIDQIIGSASASTPAAFEANDFATFQQSRPHQAPLIEQPLRREPSPPIITYPEFLVDAHKPPPLITAERVLNTAYVVGSLSALVYGASKYLCAPMAASLNDARHDLALHSHSKIEQLNERLSKLTSAVPPARNGDAGPGHSADGIDDESSVDSDPTELFHRDIGVQTSPPPSPPSPPAFAPNRMIDIYPIPETNGTYPAPETKDPLKSQVANLEILQGHLNAMLSRSEQLEKANHERQDAADRLHLYLDNLMYAKPATATMWSPLADDKKEKKADDGIDELRREIRSVKGVLLSTKTFPTAVR